MILFWKPLRSVEFLHHGEGVPAAYRPAGASDLTTLFSWGAACLPFLTTTRADRERVVELDGLRGESQLHENRNETSHEEAVKWREGLRPALSFF